MESSLIDGRYQLLNDIGSGGEARVFSARDETTGNEVAVRLPQRFATAALAEPPATLHKNWVKLLTSGTDPKFGSYQVFELLDGQTLGQLIPGGALDQTGWRTFVDQSLDAVEALHDANWVHGDLNAANFFDTDSGWKLLELPFYRLDPPEQRSAMFGSIHTLAPEQIDGTRPDVLSDIYSLGCLYYYAASGSYPHPGHNVQEVAIHCLRFPPDPLAGIASHLPPAWCDAVMKLVARQREDRPDSLAAARHLLAVPVA
jgi:serine/threonine protein kinase